MIYFNYDDEPCCRNHEDGHGHESTPRTDQQNVLLIACQEKLAKTEEQLRYLSADFENFRRNVTKERAQWTRLAQIKIFEDLVGVIDDFSRAVTDVASMDSMTDAERARMEGVKLIYKNFMKFLEMHGVTEIQANIPFNPQLHEAIMQVEVEGKEAGVIIDVLQKGYLYKDTVIRPAKVSIAQ